VIDLEQFRRDPEKFRNGAASKGIELDWEKIIDVDSNFRTLQHSVDEASDEAAFPGNQLAKLSGSEKSKFLAELKVAVAKLPELEAR